MVASYRHRAVGEEWERQFLSRKGVRRMDPDDHRAHQLKHAA